MTVHARQSLVCKWDDFRHFWVSMMPEASHQVSALEDIWFGRKCWFKDSKMVVKCWTLFDILMEWFQPICLLPPIKFLLKMIYGFEDDVVWRIPRWLLFSARQSLICKWDDFSYSESPCCLTHPIKLLLETLYGLEDVVWRISRCLFSSYI